MSQAPEDFVPGSSSTEGASAQALFNDYARPEQIVQAQTVRQRAVRLPAGVYASTRSERQVRSSQHSATPQAVAPQRDFQLGGEHVD